MKRRILYLANMADSGAPMAALAEACFSLTPKVSVVEGREVYLDIASTEKLFGGEARLLMMAEDLVASFGIGATLVMTDRPEWARVLATETRVVMAPGESAPRLYALPLERLLHCGDPLRLEEEMKERATLVAFMRRVGMHVIGDFARLPPAAIVRRFGKGGILLHEWVTGKRECVLPLYTPTEPIREILDAEDIASLDALLFLLRQSLIRVEARLHGRLLAAKRLHITFSLDSGESFTRTLELSTPLQDAQAMLRLLREFLSGLRWESPLLSLVLEVTDSVPHRAGQLSLFDDRESRFHDLAEYVGRLRARLGDHAVGMPRLLGNHLPERSWEKVWPPVAPPPRREHYPLRPLFLFTPPRACSAPRQWELMPSENLAVEWWEDTGERRYFIAKNREGERLWVFWDAKQREWFLHGIFD